MGDRKASVRKSMIDAEIRTIDAFSYLTNEVRGIEMGCDDFLLTALRSSRSIVKSSKAFNGETVERLSENIVEVRSKSKVNNDYDA
ncbi:hypothetical protein IEQ34_015971 [Dendrobium chrysotoxum]|uniref:Uncharacterized protein n=1 Tax=Dendrobium chrysotoxum TaxID=161865 RepID=A0AAV7G285_DENCH|nr:hypothetical protein IEQ34_015971 [Dendrobium chrysotoxum]